jgi:hypothetical protein
MANWLARAQGIAARPAPANDATSPAATPKQAAELRELVAVIFPGESAADLADVLATACADPEAALTSFRLLAADVAERQRHAARFGGA